MQVSQMRDHVALAACGCVGVALLLFRRRAKKHIEGGDLTIAAMAAQWRQDLLENVVPFWERVSIDSEYGGFFTAVDRDGTLLDDSKYAWLQGRAVYMWSKLHNDFYDELPDATTERWLGYACNGARFLEKLKDPTGRLYFAVSRDGSRPLHFQRKPYAAVFYVLACIEHSQALLRRAAFVSGDVAEAAVPGNLYNQSAWWREEAIRYFDLFAHWLDHPEALGGLARDESSADGVGGLAGVMCLASLSEALLDACPEQRTRFLEHVAEAQRRVRLHYDPQRKVFRENAHATRGVDDSTAAGRLFNPGHSVEVAWFVLRLCELRPDASLRALALDVLEHSLALGWDAEQGGGGLLYMMDLCGKPLADCTVTAEHKLWWPMSEALCALMLAIELTGDEARWLPWLRKVHAFIYSRLCDAPYEWYGYLRRDGSPANACKGGNYKGFFHVPRGLLLSLRSAERHLAKHSSSRDSQASHVDLEG
jgi:N-acylglucosamine 2-epimerase